jgi:hypothetical protein
MPVTKHLITRHLHTTTNRSSVDVTLQTFNTTTWRYSIYYAAGNPTLSRGWHEAVYILAVWYISRWSQVNYRLHRQLQKQAIEHKYFSTRMPPNFWGKKSLLLEGSQVPSVRPGFFFICVYWFQPVLYHLATPRGIYRDVYSGVVTEMFTGDPILPLFLRV